MKKAILILSFVAITLSSYSQMSVSGLTSISLTKVGLGYDFNSRFSVDLHMMSGFELIDITPELTVKYNFIDQPTYQTYVGAGASVNGYNCLVFPIGVKVYPFENKQFGFQFEWEPAYNFEIEAGVMYTSIGFRYYLGPR